MALQVGDIEITAMSDGEASLPPIYFPNADWSVHQSLLGADGTLKIPIGCFLIRTGNSTVLIDAGLGPLDGGFMRGGDLPDRLSESGVSPNDIDIVVCSHLHGDHMGWLVQNDSPFFGSATVRMGAADWHHFYTNADPNDFARQKLQVLESAGVVSVIDSDSTVVPGIDTLHAPGHTPGHLCIVVSSGDSRAVLLGDAVTCPIQLEETDWEAMSDVDPSLAKRTRESLWRELESSGDLTVAAHFPDLKFGRIMSGEGKRYFS